MRLRCEAVAPGELTLLLFPMSAPVSKPSVSRNPLLETLSATFPVFRAGQPLSIGIHKGIKLRMPDVNDGALRTTLKAYTASTKYLKAIAHGKQRFDLDGNPAGDVTAEQRQQAQDTLKERFRKAAERKKAEEEARQREEKLLQLVDKFKRQ
jgi:ProP effector